MTWVLTGGAGFICYGFGPHGGRHDNRGWCNGEPWRVVQQGSEAEEPWRVVQRESEAEEPRRVVRQRRQSQMNLQWGGTMSSGNQTACSADTKLLAALTKQCARTYGGVVAAELSLAGLQIATLIYIQPRNDWT